MLITYLPTYLELQNCDILQRHSRSVVREKVVRYQDRHRVIYDDSRWKLLKELRERAREVMRILPVRSYVHGSVARGDVTKRSDIDIVILEHIPTYLLESCIEYEKRTIMQATPNSAIKVVYQIDPVVSIVLPLTPLSEREYQFYDFGGKSDLSDDGRVMGINKKLLFIEPTAEGHIEWSVIGREHECARLLNIDVDTVFERVRVLSRRDRVGRTGVYMREDVPPDRSVEEYLRILADRDPVVRRVVNGK